MRSHHKLFALATLLTLLLAPLALAERTGAPTEPTVTLATADAVAARTALPFDTTAGSSRLVDDPAPAWAEATGVICQYTCPMNMVQLCPQIQGTTVTCESGCCVYC